MIAGDFCTHQCPWCLCVKIGSVNRLIFDCSRYRSYFHVIKQSGNVFCKSSQSKEIISPVEEIPQLTNIIDLKSRSVYYYTLSFKSFEIKINYEGHEKSLLWVIKSHSWKNYGCWGTCLKIYLWARGVTKFDYGRVVVIWRPASPFHNNNAGNECMSIYVNSDYSINLS